MGRLLIRNVYNNKWLDSCKNPISVRSPDNRSWIRINPKKLHMRDGANFAFIENDCSFNPRFDAECEFGVINSVSCPAGVPAMELGSGDGSSSGGDRFDILEGYPAGYDMHDAGESGFGLERNEGTVKGWSLKRPGLNFALESYDDTGTTPSYGRGNYSNPNYMGSSVFSGGAQITETVFNTGQNPGFFEVNFASYDEKGISVDVYYLGNRIATTCGRVIGRSKIEFFLDQIIGEGEERIMIRIRGEENTRWVYQVMGPKPSLAVYDLDNTNLPQFLQLYTDEYTGTPVYPAPCHATVFPLEPRLEDGKWFYEFHHYIGPVSDPLVPWLMTLDYSSWLNADKFEVYHGGERIASTMDPAQGLGMLQFLWKPYKFNVSVPDLMVRVTANDRLSEDDIQSWYYTLFCPNVIGYRASPWPCATPESGVSSMGHSSTEDNYNLDNGIDPGVVSIKVEGHGDFQYVITVFDMDMNVIETKTARRVSFTQFIVNSAVDNGRRKQVAVRIDAPLGSSWTYYVGCPIPLLDIELDDKTIPACNDEIQLIVNDGSVVKGQMAQFNVSTNVPVPNDITFSYVTVDGTAKSVGGSTGVGGVFGIMNEANTLSTFAVQNFTGTAGSMIVDASYSRMMDSVHKTALGSSLNDSIATSTFVNLTPDAKLLVNALKQKIPDLTNKVWVILCSGDTVPEWYDKCQNFFQAMRNIYNMTIVATPYRTTPSNSNTWAIALANNNADIITVADSATWFQMSGFSVAAVYMSGNTAGWGTTFANHIRAGKVLHYVMRVHPTDMHRNYWSNGALQATLNAFSEDKIKFDATKYANRPTPQYFVQDHIDDLPSSPLVQGIDVAAAWDGSFAEGWLEYTPDQTAIAPDYVTASGTATITTGNVSVLVPVETLNPSHDNTGRKFYLNISNPVGATILDAQGEMTILKPTVGGGTVTDFNFTKSNFNATGYGFTSGSTYITAGAGVKLSIGFSQAQDNTHPAIVQPGKVAYVEIQGGLVADPRAVNRHGVCASYPHDPALTYEYKWECTEIFNDINMPSAIASVQPSGTDVYSSANAEIIIGTVTGCRAGGRSTWRVYAYIRASNGTVYKSNELTLNIMEYGATGGGGGGRDPISPPTVEQ